LSTFANEDWRVAIIVAGAGAGKSVLAAQWFAASTECGGARFLADAADDRPARFWSYVVAALQRSRPGAFDGSELLLRSRTGRSELFVSQLLHEAERLDRQIVLMIEDLHTIHDASILSTLQEIVEYLPAQLRLVLTSRRDLALPVARWRARSWLVEVRQQDLAFDLGEAEQLLCALGVDGLAGEQIESLRIQTDGLVAALQLAAVAARGGDAHDVIRGFNGKNRIVADFIGSEVVDKQPEDVREFMICTSIAETLDPELCDALTQRSDSGLQIRAIEADTHFLTRLDDDRPSYRYHPLLREVLRAELTQRDPERVGRLHRVAAEVLEQRGESLAAARHLMAIDEYEPAFELLFDRIGRDWKQGDLDAATAWLDAVPVELIEQNAHRMLLYGLALCMCWRLDEASAWLARARAIVASSPSADEDEAVLEDALALMLFTLGGAGDGAARRCRVLDRTTRLPDLTFLRGTMQSNLARAQLLDNEPVRAFEWVDRDVGGIGDGALPLGVSARIALRLGHVVAAAECAGQALAAAETFGAPYDIETIDARLAQLGVAIQRDELASVPPMLEALHDISERLPTFTYRFLIAMEEVRVIRARSGLDAALAALTELRGWFDDRERPALQGRLDALEARFLMDAGEPGRAEALVRRLPAGASPRGLLQARLLLCRGEANAARVALRGLELDNPRDQLHARLLDTRAAMLLGEELDDTVARVVELAAPERFVRVLREEDEAITRLVRRAAEASAAFGSERLATALGAPARRHHATTVSLVLSDRERDVLRFLPTRLTNAEIASECLMSVNTVKAHLKKIYSKLMVTTRAEAVERARILGELPSTTHLRALSLEQPELSGALP
jgi:LuxR family maltose regulon positive regulatory protein